jgi:hypothetical protein
MAALETILTAAGRPVRTLSAARTSAKLPLDACMDVYVCMHTLVCVRVRER